MKVTRRQVSPSGVLHISVPASGIKRLNSALAYIQAANPDVLMSRAIVSLIEAHAMSLGWKPGGRSAKGKEEAEAA